MNTQFDRVFVVKKANIYVDGKFRTTSSFRITAGRRPAGIHPRPDVYCTPRGRRSSEIFFSSVPLGKW